jgi:hypothetical protein
MTVETVVGCSFDRREIAVNELTGLTNFLAAFG